MEFNYFILSENSRWAIQRGFDDPRAAALFKYALVMAYCRGEVEFNEVTRIFADVPALKTA